MTPPHLRRNPGHLLRRAQQISWQVFADEMHGVDLTPVQYAALVAVIRQPGVEATRLASLIYFDRATIGGVIQRLVAKGLMRREDSKIDRRVKELYATPAGEALIPNVADRIERIQERLLEPFSAEQKPIFLGLLNQLIDSQQLDPGSDARKTPMRRRTAKAQP